MKNRLFSLLLVLLFIAGLLLFIMPQEDYSSLEKRNLLRNEDIALMSLAKDSDTVMKDQFFFRDEINRAYYELKLFLNKPFQSRGRQLNYLSDNVIDIGDGYLINDVLTFDETNGALVAKRGYNFNEFALKYPDVSFYVYFPTRLEEIIEIDSMAVANYGLQYRNLFIRELNDNIRYDSLKIKGEENYKEYFYKSDFHWNNHGAYQGYSDIINMIRTDYDIEAPRAIVEEIEYPYEFHGNIAAKIGGIGEGDHIRDYILADVGEYDYYVNGQKTDLNSVKEEYAKDGNNTIYSDFDLYFGDNVFERVFDFHDDHRPNLLILCDSYTNVTKEWLASHFNQTYILDLRAKDDGFTIDKYMREHDIDIVLLCQYYQNMFFNGNLFIPFE